MTDKEIIRALRVCSRRTDAQTCAECPLFDSEDCMGDMMVGAADLIERLTAENAAMREKQLNQLWKTVFAGNPERKGCYLVTVNHWLDGTPVVREAFWNGTDWLSCEKRHEITPRVTHWMPLPEAPKFADVLRGAPETPEKGEKEDA